MRHRNAIAALAIGLLITLPGAAFELKGKAPGMAVADLDLTGCDKSNNVNSGVPGYFCEDTFGGDPATYSVAIFDNRVVAVMYMTHRGFYRPALTAFEDRYGKAEQVSTYPAEFHWRRGNRLLVLKSVRGGKAYMALSIDYDILEAWNNSAAERVKKDF